ncbi:MAG: NADPH:quinone oxidoreductase family protein [Burkholderiaceae bacterium]
MSESCRALVCDRLTDDRSGVSIRDWPVRPAGPGEVRVRVRAAALNFPDLLMTAGLYQYKPPMPYVSGLEGAGEIEQIGEGVDGLRIGQPVYFGVRCGAIAELVVLPAADARPTPTGWDHAEAAAWRVGALTAYVALTRRGQLQAGETLLVHGASGGVGIPAVQLGKHLGATVIATGTSDEKLRAVTAAGADHVINVRGGDGREPGFKDAVKALTGGAGADVIYDPVGGDVFDESLRCIAWDGRLLVVGFASGRIPSVNVNLPLIKGFSVVGVRAGEYGRRNPAKGAENMAAIQRLAEQGLFKPHIGARFDLDHALDAMQCLADRAVAGKVVVTL